MNGFIYLATPYSHPDPTVVEYRYREAVEHTAYLLSLKRWCYSPIVHCHEMARQCNLPTDAAYWREYNETMMRAASELHVYCIDGWKASLGVAHEIAFWQSLKRDVIFTVPAFTTA